MLNTTGIAEGSCPNYMGKSEIPRGLLQPEYRNDRRFETEEPYSIYRDKPRDLEAWVKKTFFW